MVPKWEIPKLTTEIWKSYALMQCSSLLKWTTYLSIAHICIKSSSFSANHVVESLSCPSSPHMKWISENSKGMKNKRVRFIDVRLTQNNKGISNECLPLTNRSLADPQSFECTMFCHQTWRQHLVYSYGLLSTPPSKCQCRLSSSLGPKY